MLFRVHEACMRSPLAFRNSHEFDFFGGIPHAADKKAHPLC